MAGGHNQVERDRHEHRQSRVKNHAIAATGSIRLMRKIRIRKPRRHANFLLHRMNPERKETCSPKVYSVLAQKNPQGLHAKVMEEIADVCEPDHKTASCTVSVGLPRALLSLDRECSAANFTPAVGVCGGFCITIDRETIDRLTALRRVGESYSDVIMRLAEADD
jgi:hypothetical protein